MTTLEVVGRVMLLKGGASNAQRIADCSVAQWSLDNRVQPNSESVKNLESLSLKSSLSSIIFSVNGNQLEVVRSAKLLGVIMV